MDRIGDIPESDATAEGGEDFYILELEMAEVELSNRKLPGVDELMTEVI